MWKIVLFLCLSAFLTTPCAETDSYAEGGPESHFQLSPAKDISLTVLAALSAFYGNYRLGEMEVPSPEDVREKSWLLPWDRPVAGRYSERADNVSRGASLLAAVPLVLGGVSLYRGDVCGSDFAAFSLMFAQALAFQSGLNLLVRSLEIWPRPYIYAEDGDGAEKARGADGEAYGSFFSGHASAAFTVAVFAGEWFSEVYPNSRYKSLVWASSLSLAGFVGVLRIAAGKHYPTDVVVGALAGTGVSLAVLQAHKKTGKNAPESRFHAWAFPGMAGLTFLF